MPDPGKFLLLAGFSSTLYMTGVIAVVQRVHYPLMSRVHDSAFRAYHADHVRLISAVVLVPMCVELLSSGLLLLWPPPGSSPVLVVAGFAAALATWGVTACWSVPCHEALAQGFDLNVHRRLVRTNWVRTVAWFVHAVILVILVYSALS